MEKYISIDIGGTSTRIALINEDMNIESVRRFPTDVENPNITIQNLVDEIKKYAESVNAIGLSCPGPSDNKQGIVLNPPNLSGWHNLHLKQKLENQTGLKVFMENDANLAALAESKVPSRANQQIVQYVTISTGIGGGLIINGEIFGGAHTHAQELGNIIMNPGGFKLGALQEGSIESLSSGTGITARATDKGVRVNNTAQVYALAKQGNIICTEILDDALEVIANLIALLYAVVDPHIVVLGGGLINHNPEIIDTVRTRVVDKVYPTIKEYVNIEASVYKDDSGLIGGMIYAMHQYHSCTSNHTDNL